MKILQNLRASRALRAAKTAAKRTASKDFYSPDDPNGSYTGVPEEGLPVQDADDL